MKAPVGTAGALYLIEFPIRLYSDSTISLGSLMVALGIIKLVGN